MDGPDTLRIGPDFTAFVPDPSTGVHLYRVGATLPLPTGELLVENLSARELLVFDDEGGLVRVVGGRGDGPGEFGPLRGTFLCGSATPSIFVVHGARLSVFGLDGSLTRTERLPTTLQQAGRQEVLSLLPGCTEVVIREGDGNETVRLDERRVAHRVELLRVSLDDGASTSLGFFRMGEMVSNASGRPGGALPFAYTGVWAVREARGELLYGWGDKASLDRISIEDGTPRGTLRWAATPQDVSAADWARYSEDREQIVAADPVRESFYMRRSDYPRPERAPFFASSLRGRPALIATREGGVWVRRFTRSFAVPAERPLPASYWWTFDQEDRWRGIVETPPGFEVRWVDRTYVLGVSRDTFGEEQVRRYAIPDRE